MSSWLAAVQDLLRDGLLVANDELREDDPGSTCAPVKIRRSGKTAVISFNQPIPFWGQAVAAKDRLFPLFRDQQGVARMCDYWIFCEREQGGAQVLWVILCELKSGKADGWAQLDNGRMLAEYFVRMVQHHRGVTGRVEYRGIVFSHHAMAPKAGLRPGQTVYTAKSGKLGTPVAFLRDGGVCEISALCT